MNNLLTREPEEITTAKINEFLVSFGLMEKLTKEERLQCIAIAKEFQLNPIKREIHFVKYDNSKKAVSIVMGYDVFIKRAERIGTLNGWKAWTEGTGADLVAKIEIHRKDWQFPFTHEVYYSEAVQKKKNYDTGKEEPNSIWQKMPRFMLKKVAIGQGFRLCFPDELGGLPYLPEEIGAEVQDMKQAEPVDNKKPDDPPASEALTAAGAKVKAWIKEHKEKFPAESEIRKSFAETFMSFVTAKDEAGAIAYAEELPVFVETPAEVVEIDAVSPEKIAEIFGTPTSGTTPPPEDESQLDIF